MTDIEYVSAAPSRGGVQQRHRGEGAGVRCSGRANARLTYGGDFQDPMYALSRAFDEALKRVNSIQPVTELDPTTVTSENLTVDQWRAKRALAAKLARKYYNWKSMQPYARWLRQGRPLTMWQCAVILNLSKAIKKWVVEHGSTDKDDGRPVLGDEDPDQSPPKR